MRNKIVLPFGLGVQALDEELIQEHWGQGDNLRKDRRVPVVDDLPGGLVAFGAVGPGDIEPEGIGGSLRQEVLPGGERFHLIQLIFNQAVGRFQIGLPGVGPWRDGLMREAGHRFDRAGEGAVVASIPGADEFAAVIRLDAAALQADTALLEVRQQTLRKEGGIGQGALLGVGEELEAADDLAGGILDLREPILTDLGPEFGDVGEHFGVQVELLEQAPGGFDGSQILVGFGLVPFLPEQPGLPPEFADGLVTDRELEEALDPGRAPGGQLALERQGLVTCFGRDALGRVMGDSAVLLQSLPALRLPALDPLPDGLGRGPEQAGGGLDAPLLG